MPEGPEASRKEELQKLSDGDIKDLFFNTFAREADENLTTDELIDQIIAQVPDAPKVAPREEKKEPTKAELKKSGQTVFTSKETGKEFKMTGDLKGHVVVRQVSVQELNGGMVEVPNTETVQSYRPEVFEEMLQNNFFSESKLKLEILQSA